MLISHRSFGASLPAEKKRNFEIGLFWSAVVITALKGHVQGNEKGKFKESSAFQMGQV